MMMTNIIYVKRSFEGVVGTIAEDKESMESELTFRARISERYKKRRCAGFALSRFFGFSVSSDDDEKHFDPDLREEEEEDLSSVLAFCARGDIKKKKKVRLRRRFLGVER